MQYEQVYHIVDEIFAHYNGKGCDECARRMHLFSQIMNCARMAEEAGYDDETVLAAFLPDITYFLQEQKKAAQQTALSYKLPLMRHDDRGNGNTQPGAVAADDIWHMKEKIARYIISLVDGPAKAYV